MDDSIQDSRLTLTSRPKILGALIVAGLAALAAMSVMASYGWRVPEESTPPTGDANGVISAISPEGLREKAELPAVALKLKTRLEEKPEDPDGWALLARTYSRLGQYEPAKDAFQKSLQRRPDDAHVLADYADTLAYLNNGTFGHESLEAIGKALQVDPKNTSALMLAGLAAFDQKDFKMAILHWEKLVKLVEAGSPQEAQVTRALNEARKQLSSGLAG